MNMLKRIVIALGLAVGLAVAVVLVFVAVFDWNRLREPIEDALTAATGREVRINGDVDVELGWVLRLVVNDLSLANAQWARPTNMVTIERTLVAVDVLSLFGEPIRLPRIELDAPRVFLRRRSDGTVNWDLGGPADEVAAPEGRSEFPRIGRLKIKGGVIAYADAAAGIDVRADVNSVTGGTGGEEVELKGSGTLKRRPFEVSFTGGSLTRLRRTDVPYPVRGRLRIGETRAAILGELRKPLEFATLDLRLMISGQNAADLYPLIGLAAPATPPYRLQGRLEKNADVWWFREFDGRLGDSDLAGTLSADLSAERPRVTGDLRSRKLDFDDLGVAVGAPSATGKGETVNPTQRRLAKRYAEQRRVLPDAPLDLSRVRAMDAHVEFSASEVLAPGWPLGDVEVTLDLDKGVLALSPAKMAAAGGKIASEISIDARRTPVTTYWNIRVSGFDLGQVAEGMVGNGEVVGRLQFQTVGQSIREALSTANGDAAFVIDDGWLNALAIEALGLDVLETLMVLDVGEEEPPSRVPLRCTVAAFGLVDGRVQTRAFLIDTSDSLITADGEVNFGTERYRMRLLAHPKDVGVLTARSPIEVSGTFRSFNVGVSAGALAVRAGTAAVLGAVLTPAASALAFMEPGLAENAPCRQLIEEARVGGAD